MANASELLLDVSKSRAVNQGLLEVASRMIRELEALGVNEGRAYRLTPPLGDAAPRRPATLGIPPQPGFSRATQPIVEHAELPATIAAVAGEFLCQPLCQNPNGRRLTLVGERTPKA